MKSNKSGQGQLSEMKNYKFRPILAQLIRKSKNPANPNSISAKNADTSELILSSYNLNCSNRFFSGYITAIHEM